MPHQNRVTPFSELIVTPARGTLMGNRGTLHDGHQTLRRPYHGQRWILCLLTFKNRRRSVMAPGQYTELFFLDEATGLAAGHRPCAECQRERFNLFRETWAKANPALAKTPRPAAPDLDAILHRERLTPDGQQQTYLARIDALPDGCFVTLDDDPNAYLILNDQLLRWSPFGYDTVLKRPAAVDVHVLTPPSVVRTLAAGYPVEFHLSAIHPLVIARKAK